MAAYINFEALKGAVTFEQILEHYGIEVVSSKGDELSVLCPFHEDTRPSLKANVARGVFKCFSGSCNAQGDIIAFVRLWG